MDYKDQKHNLNCRISLKEPKGKMIFFNREPFLKWRQKYLKLRTNQVTLNLNFRQYPPVRRY